MGKFYNIAIKNGILKDDIEDKKQKENIKKDGIKRSYIEVSRKENNHPSRNEYAWQESGAGQGHEKWQDDNGKWHSGEGE